MTRASHVNDSATLRPFLFAVALALDLLAFRSAPPRVLSRHYYQVISIGEDIAGDLCVGLGEECNGVRGMFNPLTVERGNEVTRE